MKKPSSFRVVLVFLCCFGFMPASVLAEDLVIPVSSLNSAPVLDGKLVDWSSQPLKIPMSKAHPGVTVDVSELEIWAGHHGDMVYFAFRWADESPDRQHKPWVWDDETQRYAVGSQREDRFAIQFAIDGDYDVNWLAGNEFLADMWHWKSARSAPLGLAHDKMTIISRSALSRAFKINSVDGSFVYIRRPSDAGEPIYSSKRYGLKESKQMPKYILNSEVSGSVADVKAGQSWSGGFWTVELARKLDTGNEDDVVFALGNKVRGGIAVFNRTGDSDHVISPNLVFTFER